MVHKDSVGGRFKFTPARLKRIPNAPDSFRSLIIANPREKIVQKAIQVILNAIWGAQFSGNSYGIGPPKSTRDALDRLHIRGGNFN